MAFYPNFIIVKYDWHECSREAKRFSGRFNKHFLLRQSSILSGVREAQKNLISMCNHSTFEIEGQYSKKYAQNPIVFALRYFERFRKNHRWAWLDINTIIHISLSLSGLPSRSNKMSHKKAWKYYWVFELRKVFYWA